MPCHIKQISLAHTVIQSYLALTFSTQYLCTYVLYCHSQEYKFLHSNQTSCHHEWTTEEKNNGYVVFKWKSLDHLGNYREGDGYSASPLSTAGFWTERRRERFFLQFGYFFMDDTQHPQPPKMPSTLCLVSAFSYVVFPYSTTTVNYSYVLSCLVFSCQL